MKMSFQPLEGTITWKITSDLHIFLNHKWWRHLKFLSKDTKRLFYMKQNVFVSKKKGEKKPPTKSSWAGRKGAEQNILGDPGNQRFCLEDHLISVAALDQFTVNQTAKSQTVRIWRWKDPGHCQHFLAEEPLCSAPGPPLPAWLIMIIHL